MHILQINLPNNGSCTIPVDCKETAEKFVELATAYCNNVMSHLDCDVWATPADVPTKHTLRTFTDGVMSNIEDIEYKGITMQPVEDYAIWWNLQIFPTKMPQPVVVDAIIQAASVKAAVGFQSLLAAIDAALHDAKVYPDYANATNVLHVNADNTYDAWQDANGHSIGVLTHMYEDLTDYFNQHGVNGYTKETEQ